METIRRICHYLANLEWTERVQHYCRFCDRANYGKILFEDDDVVVIENLRLAGREHWLILPKLHIRDAESVGVEHLELLKKMDVVKQHLIKQRCSDLPRWSIVSGYHRGRRRLIGNIYYPDIISVHHLHLHVIVEPYFLMRVFKYPAWLTLMWKSDAKLIAEVQRRV